SGGRRGVVGRNQVRATDLGSSSVVVADDRARLPCAVAAVQGHPDCAALPPQGHRRFRLMAAIWPASVRPTFWPTLFTIPALIVLIGLGVWQLERLAWKRHIIETVESRIHAAPVPLPAGEA